MAERDLTYRFKTAGVQDVLGAISGIQAHIRRMGQEEAEIVRATVRTKAKSRDEEVRHASALARTQMAIERARAREAVRAAEQAERDKAKALEREARQRQRVASAEQKAIIRAKDDEVRAFEKAEREKTRIADRERASRERQERRAAEREYRRAVADEERRQRDRAFDTKRMYRSLATGVVEGGIGAVRMGGRLAAGSLRAVAAGTGITEAYDLTGIIAERMKIQAMMRGVAIEARTAGSKFGGFDEAGGMAKIRAAARATGLSQGDLAAAIDKYSEMGSGATAVTNIDRIARQAKAMGTDAVTVAKLRAQMGISSGVAGKELSEDEKDDLIAKMHFIGKTGVFRAEALAQESESLFSQFGKSGGDFRTDFTRYITFANEARKATGSGAMARTAINSVQDQIAKKEALINSLGIRTMDDDGTGRFFVDTAMDVIQKTGGRGAVFNKIFDPAKSGKALSTLVTAFQSAGGGAKGRAAMEEILTGDASIKKATIGQMMMDADAAINEPGNQIKMRVEESRQRILEALVPALEKLAEVAPKLAAAFSAAIDFVQKNPMLAGAAAVGGSALLGGGRALASHGIGGIARFLADGLVNTVPRLGGGAAGAVLRGVGAAGGILAKAGATPVWIVGADPSVGGFGGGGLPGMGGVGGLLGAGGVGELAAVGGGGAAAGGALAVLAPMAGAMIAGAIIGSVINGIKDGVWDQKDQGKVQTEQVTDIQSKQIDKLAQADADPYERQLLADMMGWGVADPRLDKMVRKVGDLDPEMEAYLRQKPLAGIGQMQDKIVDEVFGPAGGGSTKHGMWSSLTNHGGAELYDLPMAKGEGLEQGGQLGQYLMGAQPKPGGDLKSMLDSEIALEKFSKSLAGASEKLESLDATLVSLNGNKSALKTPPPR